MVISNLLALASWIWRSRDTLLFPTPNFSILFAASLVLCPLRTNLGIETDLFAVKNNAFLLISDLETGQMYNSCFVNQCFRIVCYYCTSFLQASTFVARLL